ncbi:MAG: thiamine pyrophosphate-dependent enzyme [Nanoarchaeota archaeon]
METNWTIESLKKFEQETADLFNDGKLKSPVHLSGSIDDKLEEFLIKTFKDIKPNDWIATTYRSHYHSLLKGVPEERLKAWILDNKSIHFMDSEYKMFSSAIVGGTLPTALGIAVGLKLKQNMILTSEKEMNKQGYYKQKVWVFIGDMTANTGVFKEVFKYTVNHKLPIKFIVENNFLSTDTPTHEVWGLNKQDFIFQFEMLKELYPDYFDYITYERKWPHYGTGKFVAKLWEEKDVKAKGF